MTWTPEMWALWTLDLHRPGKQDDEWAPDDVRFTWWPIGHLEGWTAVTPWGNRPTWPDLVYAQRRQGPAPTDWCNVEGRCNGACKAKETP